MALIHLSRLQTRLPAAPQQACRRVEGLAAKDAEQLQQAIQGSGGGLAASIQPAAEEAPSFWVNIPGLPNKTVVDKKAGELKLFGVTDFHVMQAEGGGFVISLGLFKSEAGANEFLQGLNRRGVKSARVDAKAKPPALVYLEVRGTADLLAKRLPELLAGVGEATASDCP